MLVNRSRLLDGLHSRLDGVLKRLHLAELRLEYDPLRFENPPDELERFPVFQAGEVDEVFGVRRRHVCLLVRG